MASIKKQYENESSSRVEELSTRNQQLESQLKEHKKELESLRAECATYSTRISEAEDDQEKRLKEEKTKLGEELKLKEKYYEELMSEIDEKHREQLDTDRKEIERLKSEIGELREAAAAAAAAKKTTVTPLASAATANKAEENRLRVECEQLRKQYDELKYSYDDLLDEKAQLFSTLSELKQQSSQSGDVEITRLNASIREKERIISDLESRLKANEASTSSRSYLPHIDYKSSPTTTMASHTFGRSLMTELSEHESSSNHSNHMTLEATEIDYLRRIVYSYMMGTDPVTMAKVIVAVLRFPEDQRQKLIENEKSKNASWLAKFPPAN